VLAGCKLYNKNVSVDTFCDNFATTDVKRLFLSSASAPQGSEAHRLHAVSFEAKFKGPVLGVAFLWSHVTGTVALPQVRAWPVGNTDDRVYHRVLITHESRSRIMELVEVPALVEALDLVAKIDKNNPRKRMETDPKDPETCMRLFYAKKKPKTTPGSKVSKE
jgi:hypothetical protein